MKVATEGPDLTIEALADIRNRFLPMVSYVQQEYGYRVPTGYPVIHDDIKRGVVGLELDPGHSLYITFDGTDLHADVTYRSSRYDARSSASREKFAGTMVLDRRPL